jgi:hypothetical protein
MAGPTLLMSSSSAMISDIWPSLWARMCSTRAVSLMVASVGGMAIASGLTWGRLTFIGAVLAMPLNDAAEMNEVSAPTDEVECLLSEVLELHATVLSMP